MKEELRKDIGRIVDGLKVEHYDIMHQHGYADFKLGDDYQEDNSYDKAEKWLSEVYDDAFMKLFDEYVNARLIEELHGVGNAAVDAESSAVMDYVDHRLNELREDQEK